MEIDWLRYSSQSQTTMSVVHIDKVFMGHGLEDKFRLKKIPQETRIPAGRYRIVLREHGGHYNDYTRKYEGHKGMLEISNIPNYSDVLIHIGNDKSDTAGCPLIGTTPTNNKTDVGYIANSTDAYLKFYFAVLPALEKGEDVFINMIDYDIPNGI